MTDAVKTWIEERQAIHAKATPGVWEEDTVSGLEGCVYLADGGYECVADAISTDDAGPIVDAHNNLPRALNALNKVLERHRPVDGPWGPDEEFCEECSCAPWSVWASWPCATVQAIEGAIND